jgi:imidazolonepropionase-like amidohydrolase
MAGRGVGSIEHGSVAVETGRIVKVRKSHEFFETDSELAKDVRVGLL